MLKSVIFLFLCATVRFGRADYCQDNFTLSELPDGLLAEALSIIIDGFIDDFFGCFGDYSISTNDVKFWLYNSDYPDDPMLLDPSNVTELNASVPIKILIPGWTCNVTNDRMPELKDAYLNRYDCNVIGIDWSAKSIDLYTNSFCSAPGVAKIIGDFLCQLGANNEVDISEMVHVVGHSMGAQIAGLVGKHVQKECGRVLYRITGLDPAGPLYQELSHTERLTDTDARMVDVIHTNQGMLGYYGSCGIVDFFPNCGYFQPGCATIDLLSPIESIIRLPQSILSCSHFRSVDYMIESINDNSSSTFLARSCPLCPGLPLLGSCIPNIFSSETTPMGENCPQDSPEGKFYLTTNSEAPYAD